MSGQEVGKVEVGKVEVGKVEVGKVEVGKVEVGKAWVHAFAAELGVQPPSDEEFETLLNIAGVAAHASERLAAPIACWLIGRAGIAADEAMKHARSLQ
jgi:hypothetical protein